jgi:hypothetical protein
MYITKTTFSLHTSVHVLNPEVQIRNVLEYARVQRPQDPILEAVWWFMGLYTSIQV